MHAIAPEDCATMLDVRREIDRVDRALVTLLVERQGYIGRAAQIKTSRAVVRDEARIADVIAKVQQEAKAKGLDQTIAENVWRTLIESSIAFELVKFDVKRETSAQ